MSFLLFYLLALMHLCAVNSAIENCNYSSYYYDYCLECEPGYTLNSMSTCSSTSCPGPSNCETCDSDGNCLTCPTSYTLDGTTCVACPEDCSQCEVLESGALNCTGCYENYYQTLSQGITQCVKCPTGQVSTGLTASCSNCSEVFENCEFCYSPKYCISCVLGYQANWDTGLCEVCPPGTISAQYPGYSYENNYCENCPQGTWSMGGTSSECSPCGENCYTCNGITTCGQCYYPYQPDPETGQCIPTCPAGQYFITNPLPMCFTCPNGEYNSLPHATSCSVCPAGKYTNNDFIQSSCMNCPAGQYASSPGSAYCQTCYNGYVSSDGSTCEACPLGCVSCGGEEECLSCDYGYGLYTVNGVSICQACPINTYNSIYGATGSCLSCGGCATCDPVSAACQSCPTNTQFLDYTTGTCRPCDLYDTGCVTCIAGTVCSTCSSGYFLGPDYKCFPCSEAQSLGYSC